MTIRSFIERNSLSNLFAYFCDDSEESLEHPFMLCQFTSNHLVESHKLANSANLFTVVLSIIIFWSNILKPRARWLLLDHIIITAKQMRDLSPIKETKRALPHLKAKLK